MKNVKQKERAELLVPGEAVWERWSSIGGAALTKDAEFPEDRASFTAVARRRCLALPTSWLRVLPAWLKGKREHLPAAAALYAERMGLRTESGAAALDVAVLVEKTDTNLVRIMALGEEIPALAALDQLPDACVPAASCFDLPENSLTIWRELGRLVMALSIGNRAAYFSVLGSNALDENAVREISGVCFQLGFQSVLGGLDAVVLWTREGNEQIIANTIGLPVRREARPAPRMRGRGKDALVPPALRLAKAKHDKKSRSRMIALAAGAVAALGIFLVTALTVWARMERNSLREQITTLTPKAAKVTEMQKAWSEVATAVDPEACAMEFLLCCMEPTAASQVTLTDFEFAPDHLVLRGRTTDAGKALQFSQEIKGVPSLAVLAWETSPPSIAGDNTATFELKGVRP